MLHIHTSHKVFFYPDSDEFVDKITTSDWRLAKRQITFMKRNKDIAWKNLEDARVYLADRLNSL